MRAALFVTLALLALPGKAVAVPPEIIHQDCAADGDLDRTYTRADLEAALLSIPADLDFYTNCRDVIRQAYLAATTTGVTSSGTVFTSPSQYKLTNAVARQTAVKVLRQHAYGRREFEARRGFKMSCRRESKSLLRRKCAVSWHTRRYRYRGYVRVMLSPPKTIAFASHVSRRRR
jgi:hypothetical protein